MPSEPELPALRQQGARSLHFAITAQSARCRLSQDRAPAAQGFDQPQPTAIQQAPPALHSYTCSLQHGTDLLLASARPRVAVGRLRPRPPLQLQIAIQQLPVKKQESARAWFWVAGTHTVLLLRPRLTEKGITSALPILRGMPPSWWKPQEKRLSELSYALFHVRRA